MRHWLRRFRRLSDEEFAEELASHIAHETDRQIDLGLPPEEARYAALRKFGNVTRHLERFREASPWFWIETLWQDIRYGWRSLRRSPSLFIAAVVSLALGIGGTTALFSVLYATVIDPLPFPRTDRLATLVQYDGPAGSSSRAFVGAHEFVEYTRLTDIFDGVTGFTFDHGLLNGGDTKRVLVLRITCNFFDVLGVKPELGRTPRNDDCAAGASQVAVLSHHLWSSRFRSDPAVIGRIVRFDSFGGSVPGGQRTLTVIGVMPGRVTYSHEQAWIPSSFMDSNLDPAFCSLVARLRGGATYAQADSRVAALSSRIVAARPADFPFKYRGRYGLEPMLDLKVRDYRTTMWALAAGVCCVLILACINIGMLLFARATARQAEMGLRVSLGATRRRIVSQLLVESLVLTTIGGLLGIALAALLMTPLAQLVSATEVVVPQAAIELNAPALLAAALAMGLATLAFGVAPARHALRTNPSRALATGGTRTAGTPGGRWRSILVAAQVSLAFPVLCATIALLLSFGNLQRAASRYEPGHVLEVLPSRDSVERYQSSARLEQFWSDVEGAITAVPGVTGSATTMPSLWDGNQLGVFQPRGVTNTPGWSAQLRAASTKFFSTMRIPLLNGRTFAEADRLSRRTVAVVSRSFARKYYGGASPVGRVVELKDPPYWFSQLRNVPLEIVGTVEDIALPGNDNADVLGFVPTVYVPRSLANGFAGVLVRTGPPPLSVARDVARAIAAVDPGLVFETSILQDSLEQYWTSWPRLLVVVTTSFGMVGLLLVLTAVFGVLSYAIAQLSREIGVRLALGATPARIGRQVLARGLRWTSLGVAVGAAVTVALYTIARSLVWGLATLDPAVVAGVAGFVLLITAGTCWLPARRAMRVDPVVVLRSE